MVPRRAAVVTLLATALLVACAAPTPSPQSPAAPTPAAPPAPTRGRLEAADAPEQMRALALVEQVTGLHFTERFPVYVFTPDELAAEIADWQKADSGVVVHNVMGFYRPETRAMVLVPETAGNKRAFGLRVHEAAHALQDQHFGLARLHAVAKTQEEQRALSAFLEGYAVQVMIDALRTTNPNVTRIAEVPAPADADLDDPAAFTAFCYAAGTRFIQAVATHGFHGKTGYAAVHELFADPPRSPAEIRDPAQYFARVGGKSGE